MKEDRLRTEKDKLLAKELLLLEQEKGMLDASGVSPRF